MDRSIKIFVFILLSALFIGAVKADCPKGDLNGDCKVDFLDISVFAEQWLEPSDSDSDTNFADFDGVDGVNVSDFALLVSQWHQAGVPLVINEFMASNNSFIQDPQGQYDDWIEIYNLSSEAINVAGMYLTDNLSVPAKWQFPSDNPSVTTIPPQGYLLIWADENITDAGLHASFKLDGGGEELGLFDSDGSTLIDSIVFNGQTVDISYGRFPDAADDLRFFAVSTPGAENVGAYSGEVDEVKSSHKHGFYDVPFYVTLATETEGADIYYTLDGSEPYEFVGRGYINGAVYNCPILISSTTCLRAKAVKPGWKSSQVKTITYLMGVGEARRSLPAVSLVGDYGKTFYEPNGVMAIVGGYYGADGRWVSNGPDTYNNVIHRGMAYERPVSFELIQPGDNSGLQIDCGIRVHGSDYMRPRYRRRDGLWSGNAKFSFRLYFRSRYGEKWLEYPLFPFEVDRFRSIALRGGHNDRTNPFIKDELLRRLHKDMGNVASGGMNANLFINGEYKGYFNPCEHIKNAFCQEWYESDKDWDVMTMSGVRDGDAVAWNEMINYARSNNLSNDEHYQCISQLLDIPSFVDYLILQLWCGNWDWPQNNWSAARERSDEGMWRFFIWDAEGGMFSDRLGTVYFDRLNSQSNANGWLYRALKNNSNFKQLFSDRIYKHFYNNGALTEDNIRERFLELREEMSGVIPNMNMYVLDTWVPERLSIFLNACIQEGMYTFRGPTFEVNGFEQQGGEVSTDDAFTLTTLGRSQVIYYTIDGSDPRLPVESPIQTTSTTLVAENAAKHVLVPTGPVSNDWRGGRGFNDSVWLTTSGYPGGVGYERNSGYEEMISLDLENRMYGTNPTCYVRIPFDFNFNLSNFDFMTLKMRYDDGFVAYLNGTEVARRGFTGEPTWNSNADTGRSDSEAVNFEHIDISLFLNTLRPGNNILAIQGLNTSTTSSDLLISTELVIGDRTLIEDIEIVSPSAIEYTGSFNLDNSACVKARVLNDGIWSALNEATFSVGPVADNLRITEIMYNPYSLDDSEEPN
ncbi:MAG: chitobiase/beta-hexosaminidase C-terminal domain-containing protein, partial [Phycisphaerales bacterium]